MAPTTRIFTPVGQLMVFLVLITATVTPINGLTIPRKLDDTTVPAPPDSGIKCGSCPACNNPCYKSPPPPSPPPPPPYCPPPPPPPKKPPTPTTPYCPPPPPSGFIYITGPPGGLYPIDQNFGGGGRSFTVGLPLLIGCGLVGLMAFW